MLLEGCGVEGRGGGDGGGGVVVLAEAVAGHEAANGAWVMEAVGVQHHASGGYHDGGPAAECLAVEGREVRAHVQGGAVYGAFLGGIEDDEVGVEPFSDGSLARKGVDPGRSCGEDLDEVLHPGGRRRRPSWP